MAHGTSLVRWGACGSVGLGALAIAAEKFQEGYKECGHESSGESVVVKIEPGGERSHC